jgi:hypothetical protein
VVPVYADEQGNLIVTNGFHNRTGRVSEVAQWIKRNLPWNDNRSSFVLDPENKVATVELSDYGIYANPAIKDINPGLLRMEGYIHVQKHRDLPHWYEDTQPPQKFEKFRTKGSPKLFVFKSANVIRKELDTAKWDPEKVDKMYKSSTARFDAVEALRYVIMTKPEPSKIGEDFGDKWLNLEKIDRGAAEEWRALDRKRAAIKGAKNNALRDMDRDDEYRSVKGEEEMHHTNAKYDWGDE